MRDKCADPQLVGSRFVIITCTPGGNELDDPAPGDFNAAQYGERAGRWPCWAVAGLCRAGLHCAPELLRDQQHPCARGRLNPLSIEDRPRRARTSGATCFVVLIISAPPSQELEPAIILMRFSSFNKLVDETYAEIIAGKLSDEWYDILDYLRAWEDGGRMGAEDRGVWVLAYAR